MFKFSVPSVVDKLTSIMTSQYNVCGWYNCITLFSVLVFVLKWLASIYVAIVCHHCQ